MRYLSEEEQEKALRRFFRGRSKIELIREYTIIDPLTENASMATEVNRTVFVNNKTLRIYSGITFNGETILVSRKIPIRNTVGETLNSPLVELEVDKIDIKDRDQFIDGNETLVTSIKIHLDMNEMNKVMKEFRRLKGGIIRE